MQIIWFYFILTIFIGCLFIGMTIPPPIILIKNKKNDNSCYTNKKCFD